MYDKIFTSYAKEDFAYSELFFEFLNENSFDTWMDHKCE